MSLKTNPAYAALAYKRAIVLALLQSLRENYMALSSAEPRTQLICEDVLREDSIVPPEALQDVAEELELEAEHLRLELLKFTFTKKDTNGILASTNPTTHRQKGGGKNQRNKRSN